MGEGSDGSGLLARRGVLVGGSLANVGLGLVADAGMGGLYMEGDEVSRV